MAGGFVASMDLDAGVVLPQGRLRILIAAAWAH